MSLARVTVSLLLAAALSALAVSGATAGSGSRSTAAAAQRLAFVPLTTAAALTLIDADGSNQKRLTRCQTTGCTFGALAWSPAGTRIAFGRGFRHRAMSLFVVNANGSQLKRLAPCGPECDGPLSWSPDGSTIAYSNAGSIYTVTTRARTIRKLTRCASTPCFDFAPVWSRGSILFARRRAADTALYALDPAEPATLTELATLPRSAQNVAWSPDRTKIAFDVTADGSDYTYVLDLGAEPTVAASGPGGVGPGIPSWSPDGRSIAYFHTPRAANGFFEPEVWVSTSDGSAARRLFHADCCVFDWTPPVWSADGTQVAFAYSGPVGTGTAREYAGGTYVLSADGSSARRLVDAASKLAWQPAPR